MTVPPGLDRKIVEALVQSLLRGRDKRLILAYGRYTDGVTEFPVTVEEKRRQVHVIDEHSVLGVVEAWLDHQGSQPHDHILVVTTSVRDEELSWDIRAHAVGRQVRMADRGLIVAQRFGAADVDPRIRAEKWLLDALLAAEPHDGWPRNGSVLTRDAAVRALIGARLGRPAVAEGGLDAGALLEWSTDLTGPTRFAELPAEEREGLTDWLKAAVGPAAAVVMRLVVLGRAADALPLGAVGSAVTREGAPPEAMFGFGGLLGGGSSSAELRAFTNAAEGVLERWVAEAEAGGRSGDDPGRRVRAVLDRADELALEVDLTGSLAESPYLPSAFAHRLRQLAAALRPGERVAVAEAESALARVREHRLARLEPARLQAAEMAVRLSRWLASPQQERTTVAAAIQHHITSGAWADRALTVLWEGDGAHDPVAGKAYQEICEAVRARREASDEDFAGKLATWARHASVTEPAGCLLIEEVLARYAVPLATKARPLVVVLDGMSGAVAVDFAEQVANRGWIEVAPGTERAAAVAAIPSVTTASRATLLSGKPVTGDQVVEREGFAAFWKGRSPRQALFHKGTIGGDAGSRLSDELLTALADDKCVVGVVLNTIDDALDHGSQGDRTGWSLRDVTYLPELLDAARGYGRPVLLVSDHGHILHRTTEPPSAKSGAESARWRTGSAETGEVALAGPRVLHGDGALVAAWREDLRYTSRKAGYHGGASLAEMTVPILAFVPSHDDVPDDWHELFGRDATPQWWEPRAKAPVAAVPPEPKPKARKHKLPEDIEPLFAVDTATRSLGAKVVATDEYAAQRALVPKAPKDETVAAVIDALVEADGSLPLSTVGKIAGRSGSRAGFFAAVLERLLNRESYDSLSRVDGDRRIKLDVETLRLQFGVKDT